MEWYWYVIFALTALAVFFFFWDHDDDDPELKMLQSLIGFKLPKKTREEFMALREGVKKDDESKKNHKKEPKREIIDIVRNGHRVLCPTDEDYSSRPESFSTNLLEIYTKSELRSIYNRAKIIALSNIPNVDKFLQAYKMIKLANTRSKQEAEKEAKAKANARAKAAAAQETWEAEQPEDRIKTELTFMDFVALAKLDNVDLNSFARAWCDQVNAKLKIDFGTAYKFVSQGRDFANFVNLDLMAKRAELDLDEKNFINDIDDNGLKVVIYSLIRAKYEGIYLSEEESLLANKANVLEYIDSFKITLNLLVNMYNVGRDVKRFTDVMIRAHNSGVRIGFSLADLYSLSDDEFENLVNNVIRASDFGLNIDQKDLIRQNIQGTDITNLISALIKAHQYKIDLTPDELMSYLVNKKADVEKFVEALNFVKINDLNISKDMLVDISKADRNVFDYVQAYKIAKEYENKPDNYGITLKAVKEHFLKLGKVLKTVKTVIKAQEQLGLRMNFGIANKILTKTEGTLKEAIEWAQNPRVEEVMPRITCVCKNGVQVTPKINVTVLGDMDQYFWGYNIDVLFKRINEAVIYEFESAADHEVILNTLPQISHNVLDRINEEENKKEIKTDKTTESELNKHSKHKLLDVNIYDVEIGMNVKSELEHRQAKIDADIRRMKAEADRAKAEADIRIAMVQQYRDGIRPNFNELHKANLLAESAQDITTGYESPNQDKTDN